MSYHDIPLYPYDLDPLGIVAARKRAAAEAKARAEAEAAETKARAEAEAADADQPPEDPPPPGEAPSTRSGQGDGGDEAGADASSAAAPPPEPDGRALAPHPGEDAGNAEPAEDPKAERNRIMGAWLNEHFDTVEAMARAGEAPVRPPPPEDGPLYGDEAPPPPPPPVHVRPDDRWNKPKMAEFLRQLAATHSVTAAAKAVGMSRESAHRLRNRLKGKPFDIAWEAAFRHGYDNLAHAALELALEGEEVPHYHRGELVGTHRKRNGALIMALLKMRNQVGAPMLGRYNAAAEFWSEDWDALLQRVEAGSVRWDDEREALGEAELARLELPSAEKEVERIILRNLPDKRLDEH